MSYEGFEQNICANGHYFEHENMFMYEPECPVCLLTGEMVKPAWNNQVNQTNGGNQGEIPMEKLKQFIVKEAVTETCPTCSNCKEISPAIYRVPTMEETNPLREFTDEEDAFPIF